MGTSPYKPNFSDQSSCHRIISLYDLREKDLMLVENLEVSNHMKTGRSALSNLNVLCAICLRYRQQCSCSRAVLRKDGNLQLETHVVIETTCYHWFSISNCFKVLPHIPETVNILVCSRDTGLLRRQRLLEQQNSVGNFFG